MQRALRVEQRLYSVHKLRDATLNKPKLMERNMRFKKITFSTKTLFGLLLSIWLGVYFSFPIEYWILAILANIGFTIVKDL